MQSIDKNGNVFTAEFSEADKNGNIVCRVFNPESQSYVDTFKIKATDLGWASKEMIAQKRIYSTAY